ncbi:MAG: hypothetical protein V2I82_01295 [Halieaceae bacterium]|jgi:hypothetical protein|nr:hypothetical protein [Halieaceae bacterium]
MARSPADPGGRGELRARGGEVEAFLRQARTLQRFNAGRARLVFAIDATASRQPTWDLACELQADMFTGSADVGSLQIQLAYYRGLGELEIGGWESDTAALAQRMSRVHCAAGRTQIARLLRRVLEDSAASARALVFIGDAVEESPERLDELAGQCRLRGLPLFLFQEGADPQVRRVFESMARLSGGAYSRFDAGSAARLRELLGAVARYAAGGRAALENGSAAARLLLEQLGD